MQSLLALALSLPTVRTFKNLGGECAVPLFIWCGPVKACSPGLCFCDNVVFNGFWASESIAELFCERWLMCSEEAKVLYVGVKWLSSLSHSSPVRLSTIMGLLLVCVMFPCWHVVSWLMCRFESHCWSYRAFLSGSWRTCDSQMHYRNSNRAQEGVSGWVPEIISVL